MTVAELIEKLKDMPQDYTVARDDDGFAVNVIKIEVFDKSKYVKFK